MRTTLRLPALYPKQHDAIFTSKRYGVIEASTKSGKTVGCIIWLLTRAWGKGKDGRNYWWVAPVYLQTEIAFRRLKRMLLRADPDKRHHCVNESKMWIHLKDSGSTIWFKSADKPDSLYGEDVYDVVIDEATRCKEEAWHAVRSTITYTRGAVRIIGNVKGRRNWVYHLARKAEAGEPDHHYAKLTAHDAVQGGVLDASDVQDAKRILPAHVFGELFLAEPADDGGNPFGLDAIAACVSSISEADATCYGADLAKSVDWTVLIGLDEECRVCDLHRFQADWHATKLRIRSVVRDRYALLDMTGVGDPIVEDLQRECPQIEGFMFTARSKQLLMEGLAAAIQERRIRFPDGPIRSELESFEYEYGRSGVRYSAPEGMHDDCVCALALGVEASKRGQGALSMSVYEDDARYDLYEDDDDEDQEQWLEVSL